jgi:hypothetical protein
MQGLGNDKALRRGAGGGLGALAGPVLAGVTAGLLVAACGGAGSAPSEVHSAGPSSTAAAATAPKAVAPHAIAYDLYTHCGVDEAKIGDRFSAAVTPLSDGNGNPPAGWGNPYQAGTMTVVSATRAVFTDKAGHRVDFTVRPGARAFRHVCS